MAEIRAAMMLAFFDWHLDRHQRVRAQCLDVAEMKAAIRKLKDGKKDRPA